LRPPFLHMEGRYKATWKREFKLPWRKAGLLISMIKWTWTSRLSIKISLSLQMATHRSVKRGKNQASRCRILVSKRVLAACDLFETGTHCISLSHTPSLTVSDYLTHCLTLSHTVSHCLTHRDLPSCTRERTVWLHADGLRIHDSGF
jgi:hypothetical protein